MTPQQLNAMKLALEALKKCRYRSLADEIVDPAIAAIKEALAEHAMRETQRLGQEIEQAPVWSDAGDLKRLKKGDVVRVLRKGQEYYSAFRFDGLLHECDYTYDGDAPFVWLEVGMATLDKIVYTKKDFTTGAVYADRGDRVELFQPALEEALAQPEQEPVAWFSTLPEGRLSIKIVGKPTEGNWEPLYTTPPQRTERPVDCERCNRLEEQAYDLVGELRVANIKLSMRPQRTWVGLTDEEIWETISRIGTSDSDVNPYAKLSDARAIEAKLKEKNT